MTYNQAKTLGGTVLRGERGTPVVLWKPIERRDDRADEDGRRGFILRY